MDDTRPILLATPAPLTHRTAEGSLGLACLAAVLRRAGRTVHIVDGWLEGLEVDTLADRLAAFGPPLWVGFSCYRTNMGRAIETASLLRARGGNAPVVVGGYGPTFEPEIFLQAGFDAVAIGEAEQTVLALTNLYAAGETDLRSVPGLAFLGPKGEVVRTGPPAALTVLDAAPPPERDTYELERTRKSAAHIETSRGCRAGCTFCSIVAFARTSGAERWRQKPVERIVEEFSDLARRGARVVKVIDDSFIEPPRDLAWIERLADAMERAGVRLLLRGSVRADRVDDAKVAALKRAGFFSFSCGIENFSPLALKRMAKSASLQANIEALEAFGRHGLFIQAGHILFDHETTLAELRENLDGMRRFPWTLSKGVFTEMFAAKGTAFTRLLTKRGLLQEGVGGSMNDYYAVRDPAARAVHGALKVWQKSHSRVYDMAVDVLGAPKAVAMEDFHCFHALCGELRARDLDLLGRLLDLVEEPWGIGAAADFVQAEIDASRGWYAAFRGRVEAAYRNAGLNYDADENPFLC